VHLADCFTLQYISGPILAIVLSFAYPKFTQQHMFDPIMIYGFSIVHLVLPTIVLGLLMPSWFNWIIPSEKVLLGDKPVAPLETIDNTNAIMRIGSEETGSVPPYEEPKMMETKSTKV